MRPPRIRTTIQCQQPLTRPQRAAAARPWTSSEPQLTPDMAASRFLSRPPSLSADELGVAAWTAPSVTGLSAPRVMPDASNLL